jgi:hypothetical protein
MPVSTEVLKQDLDLLTHKQLEQVADFVAFLKFQDRRHAPVMLDPTQMANLLQSLLMKIVPLQMQA